MNQITADSGEIIRGVQLYSLHAPEVECIGKGKAHKPYEFGCKVSIATTNRRAAGGQFVLHAKAFHGNPYDGHTLQPVLEELQATTGIEVKRVYVDKGYQVHKVPKPMRVYRSGQKRGVVGVIKRELRRRSHSHRLQPPARPQLAEDTSAQNRQTNHRPNRARISAQSRFLTDDY